MEYNPNSHGFRMAVLKEALQNMKECDSSAELEAQLIQKKYGFTTRTMLSYKLALTYMKDPKSREVFKHLKLKQ